MGRKRARGRLHKARTSGPAGSMALASLGASGANMTAQPRVVPLTELVQQLTAGLRTEGTGTPTYLDMARVMPRDPRDMVPFGPNNPLIPQPLDPAGPHGSSQPRLTEYPVAWNLELGQRELPWQTLREAAALVDIIRKCIEIRKKNLRDMQWSWSVSPEALRKALEESDGTKGSDDVEAELRRKYAADIERLTTWWKMPWKSQGLNFGKWLNGVMEDYIVLDAVALYARTTFADEVVALEIVDGTTIKPLMDYRGARPSAPFPAFQQLLYGFPRGEWLADVAEDGSVVNPYTSEQLHYNVENYRSFSPYGMSDVEQALIAARIYVARQGWMLAEYTEGSTPVTFVTNQSGGQLGKGQVEWSPRQRQEYENALNADMAGNTGQRNRLKLLPPGFGIEQPKQAEERYKDTYDLFLIKTVAGHLGVTASQLGYSETQGLGNSGLHEGQAEISQRIGTRPDAAVMAELINEVSCKWLECPPEIVFNFSALDVEDEEADDALADTRIKRGSMTLNEDRKRLGKAPYSFPEADKPFFAGPAPVLLDGLEAAAAAAQEQAAALTEGKTAVDGAKAKATEAAIGEKPAAGKKVAKAAKFPEEVNRELIAYARWLRKQDGAPRRDFEFSELAGEVLPALPAYSIVKAAGRPDGADADPKAPAPDRRWPGWMVDVPLAESVAGRLIRRLTRGLDIPSLVSRFLAWAGIGEQRRPLSRQAIGMFLRADPASQAVHDAVEKSLREAYEQGYMVGNRSARAVVDFLATGATLDAQDQEALMRLPSVPEVDWSTWAPGDAEAARLALSADGTDVGLFQLWERDAIRIKGIEETQLDMLAAVLADGIERGSSGEEIAIALRGLIADPRKAHQIAVTEVNRVISASTLDSYRRMGVKTKGWLTALDQNVCKRCGANQAQGDIPLDQPFQSGELHPPGHPWCRCSLIPGAVDLDDTSWLDELDEEMRADGRL
jgi:SPP1 gp7 family putative phage head morphogenesis protein